MLANISGSPITVARAEDRRLLVRSASTRCLAAYLYAAAGLGESSTDLSWDGQTMVYEVGDLLGETERFPDGPRRTTVDVDLTRIRQERLRQGTFDDNRHAVGTDEDHFTVVEFTLDPPAGDIGLRRRVDRFPFVPDDAERLALDCYEAYNIQVSGLEQRLAAIGQPKVVIGVSGGLDSTHALIVAANAMDRLGRPRSDIHAFTLPGFATSDGTKANATRLAQALGVTFEEIDIRPAARQLLDDLDHPFSDGEPVYDVTFENVQAGLRTDYLFRLANHRGGIVLGTGDLSELALGWCTYGVGDQMSHYAVNTGVPKTLIQHLIRWVIGTGQFDAEVGAVLREILDQEISPELVPVAEGERPQSTEDAIGPYALQDFTLFHVLRQGFAPSRIAFLARHAWADADAGRLAAGLRRRPTRRLRPGHDPQVARGLRAAVLRVQPVQALGPPERSQGASRRVAVSARRLAGTLGRERPGVAARPQRPGGVGTTPTGFAAGARAVRARRRARTATSRRPDGEPLIQRRMHRIVRRAGIRPQRALEVGGYVGANSLLRSKEIRRAERWCINLVEQPTDTGIQHVVGSSNDMHMFKDNSFDLVMSCAVHEHDQKFWLSIAEMHRVLRPGGLLVVCVPGFAKRPEDHGAATATYRVHYRFDYYRFSRRAVREVFFEGFDKVQVRAVLDPPRMIGHGFKPISRRQAALRAARARLGRLRARLPRRNIRASH